MSENLISTLPEELIQEILINLDLTALINFNQTDRLASQRAKTDSEFFFRWLKHHYSNPIWLYEKYKKNVSDLTAFQAILNLLRHIELGEIAVEDSYEGFSLPRIYLLAGRQTDLNLFKHYLGTFGEIGKIHIECFFKGCCETASGVIKSLISTKEEANDTLIEFHQFCKGDWLPQFDDFKDITDALGLTEIDVDDRSLLSYNQNYYKLLAQYHGIYI